MAFATIFLGIFLTLAGIIVAVLLLRALAQQIGLGGWFDTYIWQPIQDNLINPILQGLSAPFEYIKGLFEGLLPPEMTPYATILTVAVVSSMIFGLIYIIYRLVR